MTANKVEEATTVELGALLDAGDGAVVTLVAGDTRLAVHSAVLTTRSPVFEAMFNHDTLEANSGEVLITDIEGPVLRQLVAYMYTLQAPQLSSMAPQLLAAADKYSLSALKAACEQQLAAQLATENAAATAVLAVRHSCPSLTVAAITFIKANLQVMATQGWAHAMRNQTEELLEVTRLLADPPVQTRGVSAEEKGRRLIQAAKGGDLAELQALLSVGTDVGARDEFLSTALHWAAQVGHVAVASCLMEAGADVEARNKQQDTPLHVAASRGHVAVVAMLLAASADPNARMETGWTPLHFAARYGHAEVAAVLLRAGADRGARTNQGKTPMDIARRKYNQQLIEILT